ncbi:MAG: hypothetical protein CSA34_07100 [Desulfobulbus propionicus]|nr:MAG: hypothetical protein CSA34_07100 [Desulfobulbus propionicus]
MEGMLRHPWQAPFLCNRPDKNILDLSCSNHPSTKTVPTIKGGLNPIQTKSSGAAPPTAVDPAPGCRFASRCTEAMDICRKEMPQLQKISPEHMVACHLFSNS